jgi:hypothetical protein
MNKKIILSYIIIISGLIVSLSAAYYSIVGLAKLFSGAFIAVVIMATSLEISKLIITMSLKLFWNDINYKLKLYLIPATLILMLITSLGIYGFLTAAYQKVYYEHSLYESKIKTIDDKISTYELDITNFTKEKDILIDNIKLLSNNLSISDQSIDKKTGQIITKVNNQSQKTIDNQINNYSKKINEIDININVRRDSMNNLLNLKETTFSESATVSEIGPLKHIAKLLNSDIDKIINILILIIVFVFDPLAIVMLILGLELMNNKNFNKINSQESISDIEPNIVEKFEQESKPLEDVPSQYSDFIAPEVTSEEDEEQSIDQMIDKTFKLTPDKIKNLPHELTRKIEIKNNSA